MPLASLMSILSEKVKPKEKPCMIRLFTKEDPNIQTRTHSRF
jgi:hypothetical protein